MASTYVEAWSRAALLRGVQLSIRAATGGAVALALGYVLRLDNPVYSLVAAVIVTDLSAGETRQLAWRRLVATVVGALCGTFATWVLHDSIWTIGVSILLAMLACNLVGAQESAKVGGFVCAVLVTAHPTEPWLYGLHRLIETVLGICVAWAISLVPKLLPHAEETDRGEESEARPSTTR